MTKEKAIKVAGFQEVADACGVLTFRNSANFSQLLNLLNNRTE